MSSRRPADAPIDAAAVTAIKSVDLRFGVLDLSDSAASPRVNLEQDTQPTAKKLSLEDTIKHSRLVGVSFTDVFELPGSAPVGARNKQNYRTTRRGAHTTVRDTSPETRRPRRAPADDAGPEPRVEVEVELSGDVPDGAEEVQLADATPEQLGTIVGITAPIVARADGDTEELTDNDLRATIGRDDFASFARARAILTRVLSRDNIAQGQAARDIIEGSQRDLVVPELELEERRRGAFVAAAQNAFDMPHLEEDDCAYDALVGMDHPLMLLAQKAAARPDIYQRLKVDRVPASVPVGSTHTHNSTPSSAHGCQGEHSALK